MISTSVCGKLVEEVRLVDHRDVALLAGAARDAGHGGTERGQVRLEGAADAAEAPERHPGPPQRGEHAGARFRLQAADVGGPLVVALRREGAVQPARRRQDEGQRVLGDRPVVQPAPAGDHHAGVEAGPRRVVAARGEQLDQPQLAQPAGGVGQLRVRVAPDSEHLRVEVLLGQRGVRVVGHVPGAIGGGVRHGDGGGQQHGEGHAAIFVGESIVVCTA